MCWRQVCNINILVLDTEVYSNTGGQMSKIHTSKSSRGEVCLGWETERAKKDLGMMAVTLQAACTWRSMAMGCGRHAQTLKAHLNEAEALMRGRR
jgi:hypothetical protein